jgi:Cdc6-like AAA superfamily ATPase
MDQTIVILAGLIAVSFFAVGLYSSLRRWKRKRDLLRWQATALSRRDEATSVKDLLHAETHTFKEMKKVAEGDGPVAGSGFQPTTGWRPLGTRAQRAIAPTSAEAPREKWLAIGQAFSPSAPVGRQDLFAGRTRQMEDLVDAMFERGQHAVIFGERGVGKTSLSTVMAQVFGSQRSKVAVRVNCDTTDTFDSIWRKVMDEILVASRVSSKGIEGGGMGHLESTLKEEMIGRDLTPSLVKRLLQVVSSEKECVIFLDEFDRVGSRQTAALFADTIKMLSDQLVGVTVVMVGVADNVEELVTEHQSVERALVQIQMPRMSRDELAEIVKRGLEWLDMKIEDQASSRITLLSHGFPHYTHLISQIAARMAIDDEVQEITVQHVDLAVAKVAGRAQESIIAAYDRATEGADENLFPQVLLAAALAPRDSRGFFTSAGVRPALSAITKHSYSMSSYVRHLNLMARPERGSAIQMKGNDPRFRYRFENPLLQPHVVLRALASGTINIQTIESLVGPSPSDSSEGSPAADVTETIAPSL